MFGRWWGGGAFIYIALSSNASLIQRVKRQRFCLLDRLMRQAVRAHIRKGSLWGSAFLLTLPTYTDSEKLIQGALRVFVCLFARLFGFVTSANIHVSLSQVFTFVCTSETV